MQKLNVHSDGDFFLFRLENIKRNSSVGINFSAYKNMGEKREERNESILRIHKILFLFKQIASDSWSFPIIYMWTTRKIEMTQTLTLAQVHKQNALIKRTRTLLDDFSSMHSTNDTLVCVAHDLMPCNKCSIHNIDIFVYNDLCMSSEELFKMFRTIWELKTLQPWNKLKIERMKKWRSGERGGG